MSKKGTTLSLGEFQKQLGGVDMNPLPTGPSARMPGEFRGDSRRGRGRGGFRGGDRGDREDSSSGSWLRGGGDRGGSRFEDDRQGGFRGGGGRHGDDERGGGFRGGRGGGSRYGDDDRGPMRGGRYGEEERGGSRSRADDGPWTRGGGGVDDDLERAPPRRRLPERDTPSERGGEEGRGDNTPMNWRGQGRGGDGEDIPPPRRAHDGPSERPRLNLKPRSAGTTGERMSEIAGSSVFGGARPVDTASREEEILARKLEKVGMREEGGPSTAEEWKEDEAGNLMATGAEASSAEENKPQEEKEGAPAGEGGDRPLPGRRATPEPAPLNRRWREDKQGGGMEGSYRRAGMGEREFGPPRGGGEGGGGRRRFEDGEGGRGLGGFGRRDRDREGGMEEHRRRDERETGYGAPRRGLGEGRGGDDYPRRGGWEEERERRGGGFGQGRESPGGEGGGGMDRGMPERRPLRRFAPSAGEDLSRPRRFEDSRTPPPYGSRGNSPGLPFEGERGMDRMDRSGVGPGGRGVEAAAAAKAAEAAAKAAEQEEKKAKRELEAAKRAAEEEARRAAKEAEVLRLKEEKEASAKAAAECADVAKALVVSGLKGKELWAAAQEKGDAAKGSAILEVVLGSVDSNEALASLGWMAGAQYGTVLKCLLAKDTTDQKEAVYAVQRVVEARGYPKVGGDPLLEKLFHGLYGADVLDEAAFTGWRDDDREEGNKRKAVVQTTPWFQWLETADEDDDDEEEDDDIEELNNI